MRKIWRLILKGELGQALPITLALLVIGGLTIVPSLNLTFSSVKNSRMLEEGIKGTYAAEAGVEDALWSLANGVSPSSQLSDNINDTQVNIQTVDKGMYTIYFGELIEPGEHSEYLDVTGNITWDAGADAYKYTITVTWQAESGTPPYPQITETEPVQTQTFYIDGTGNLEDYYAWVLVNREDIGAVGEITGNAYRITATAVCPETNRTTAKIVAEAMIGGGETYITSWQINN